MKIGKVYENTWLVWLEICAYIVILVSFWKFGGISVTPTLQGDSLNEFCTLVKFLHVAKPKLPFLWDMS